MTNLNFNIGDDDGRVIVVERDPAQWLNTMRSATAYIIDRQDARLADQPSRVFWFWVGFLAALLWEAVIR